MVSTKTLVIGITGTMTSGKGALNYFLIDRGFKSIRLTQPILSKGLKEKKDMGNRKNWLDILVEMRKKDGVDILAKLAAKQIEPEGRYVLCPIRNPADIKYLKKNYDALIFYVDSPFKLRYRRTFLKETVSSMSEEEFKKKDDLENNPSGKDKDFLPNISACKELADEVIENEKSLNDLNKELDKILRQYHIQKIEDQGYLEGFEV